MMVNINGIENPEDGMIVEVKPGVYYQFQASANCWKRLPGFEGIPMASISEDGLMSKEDFNKVEELLLPPPDISLTSDQCSTVFDNGKLDFISSNNDLDISSELPLVGGESKEFIIHENTHGINFEINVDSLIKELEERGNIVRRNNVGPKGETGEKGDDGEDFVLTGPNGDVGDSGANAPYPGALEEEFNEINTSKIDKVVVDVKNEGEKIVATLGILGNPSACPNSVNPIINQSDLIVILEEITNTCNDENLPDNCKVPFCGLLGCVSIASILESIHDRAVEVINDIKQQKEDAVREFLNQLSNIYNSQKGALCCSIENISSRDVNQTTRNIFSTARYSAANVYHALEVTAGGSVVNQPRNPAPRDINEFNPDIIGTLPNQDFIIQPYNPVEHDCQSCYAEVKLDYTNVGARRALITRFPAGTYVATISQCCSEFEASNNAVTSRNAGSYTIAYSASDENDSNVTQAYDFDLSTFTISENSGLSNPAIGQSISFRHQGGFLRLWLNSNSGIAVTDLDEAFTDGFLRLCINPSFCSQNCDTYSGGNVTAPPELPNFNPGQEITDPFCSMKTSHLEFYERSWNIEGCCGAYVDISGVELIVVYMSVENDDFDCGAGEYEETQCISSFMRQIGRQVAVAWPTIDGNTFFGLPREDQNMLNLMMYDEEISDVIVDKIAQNDVIRKVGNPEDVITEVIVPFVSSDVT